MPSPACPLLHEHVHGMVGELSQLGVCALHGTPKWCSARESLHGIANYRGSLSKSKKKISVDIRMLLHYYAGCMACFLPGCSGGLVCMPCAGPLQAAQLADSHVQLFAETGLSCGLAAQQSGWLCW